MRTDLFDFELPPGRIALRPANPRDAARLLVVRADGALEDRAVCDLPRLLEPGDQVVVNDTKVIPAALHGRRIGRAGTEPAIEATLHRRIDGSRWRAFVKPARKLAVGDVVRLGEEGKVCFLGQLAQRIAMKRRRRHDVERVGLRIEHRKSVMMLRRDHDVARAGARPHSAASAARGPSATGAGRAAPGGRTEH